MMNNPRVLFGIFIGLLLCVLVGMIGQQEFLLSHGERVILKTRPVDPRDIFRGDYVILRYEIQEEAADLIESDFYSYGDTHGYISLDTSQKVAVATSISKHKPDDGLYLKGEIAYNWSSEREVEFPDLAQYYVPEGRGRAVEDLRQQGDLYVEVSVSNGRGRITRLLDNDFNEVVVGDLD